MKVMVALLPLVLNRKQFCSAEKGPGPQSQALQSMQLNSRIPNQVHPAGQCLGYLPEPQKDVEIAKSLQVVRHASHTLPMRCYYTWPHQAMLTHPRYALTGTCKAKPGAEATLGTTPAG